ncbi:UNVERIFIED_CONTAM: hypothetical protein HDU68_010920 [Siphonaria sp. JEL0065]|nr:hypothetical protein HDU68_010920 [Siphonaria sp. JEL0065]
MDPSTDPTDALDLTKRIGLPVTLKIRIVASVLLPISLFAFCATFLSARINESTIISHAAMPHVLVNGSGTSLMAQAHKRSIEIFSKYLNDQKAGYILDSLYAKVGSDAGVHEFFNGYSLYGGIDSDIEPAYLQYFLPDNVPLEDLNVSSYVNPHAPEHLGTILLPILAGSIGIAYNLPDFDIKSEGKPLILDETLLAGIFSGAITWWNDTRIRELNPISGNALPKAKITVIARGEYSGTSNMFTQYLSGRSSEFNSTIGVSHTPKWPASFVRCNKSTEMVYAVSSHPNSISYIAMESIVQAASIELTVDVAVILNAKDVPRYPDVSSLISIMNYLPDQPFRRHNYLSIFDIEIPEAYPIAILSSVLLREHYYYFAPASTQDCNRVKTLVYYWYYFFSDKATIEQNIDNGWVPPHMGYLQNDNLQALKLITCNGQNVMDTLLNDLKKKQFYSDKYHEFEWDYALSFWDNTDKFQTAPVGSTFYILFYVCLVLANGVPFTNHMIKYLKMGSGRGSSSGTDQEKNEDEAERVSKRISNSIRMGVPFSIREEEEGSRQDLSVKPLQDQLQNQNPGNKRKTQNNDDDGNEDDDEEGAEEKALKAAGKVHWTFQNKIAILSMLITCFQILYLCLTRSVVVYHTVYVDIISYIGLIPDSFEYCIVLCFAVLVWLACMVYTVYFYGIMEKYYPHKLLDMGPFHAFLADFLPNYAVIFYNPSVELLAKVMECRLSTSTESPSIKTYVSSYEDICWEGGHWKLAVVSFVLVCGFTNFVVRYCKTLKHLRKEFDFADKEWYIYLDSVAKTFVVILYFNVTNKYFLGTTFVVLVLLSLCSFLGRPNSVFWYDFFRAGVYAYCSIICVCLLAYEFKIDRTDYEKRESICKLLTFAVLVVTSITCVVSTFSISTKYNAGLTKAEILKKEEDLKKFFAAFGESAYEGDEEAVELKPSVVAQEAVGAPSQQPRESAAKSVKKSMFSLNDFSRGLSGDQWKQIKNMVKTARSIDLLTRDETRAIQLAIRLEDPIVPFILFRSGNNLNKFVDSLKMKVYQVLAKTPADIVMARPPNPCVVSMISKQQTQSHIKNSNGNLNVVIGRDTLI